MRRIYIFIAITLIAFQAKARELNWSFLDNKSMGTYDFIKNNPEHDGRNVLICILDNGVDPNIPGLTETTTEKTKVIDLQDFTGQLVIPLDEAEKTEIGSDEFLSTDKIKLSGWEKLKYKPINDAYYLGMINENESYKNSAVKDINNNGKTNDIFGILVFNLGKENKITEQFKGHIKPEKDEDLWVYYIDEDADGAIDDEQPMFDYKYNYDFFNFHRGAPDVKPLITLAGNINKEEPSLTIVTCDGSHGTHCAGIAAGNNINGQEGLDGIAPGAYVASLKIGSNILSGGATTTASMKKAFEYGIKLMEKAGFDMVVYSMSYGIGSETPGRSEIDEYLEDFAYKHSKAVLVKSMGNDGPGINSTGNPSAAKGLIAVGAMVSPGSMRDLYGSSRQKPWITHFSSRGGETANPDVIAPGAAQSTVPAFSGGDAYWGTSMSTPQVAGACAVLISAAQQNNLKMNGSMIRRAIKYSAEPIQGYNTINYGRGLVDIQKAFEYLKVLANRGEYENIYNYKITTDNTFFTDLKGPAAFWKAGGYFPSGGEKQNVRIEAVYPEFMPMKEQHNFYRIFDLESDSRWLKTDKSKIYIRGEQPAQFGLIYDKSELKQPGIYTGRISAFTDNIENGGCPEFDILATVVIPHKFDFSNDFSLSCRNKTLATGEIERNFLQIPPGASSMNISMTPVSGKWFSMGLYLCAPDGRKIRRKYSQDNKDRKGIKFQIDNKELRSGTWEFIPYCHFQSRNTSYYDLNVRFYGIEATPDTINERKMPIGAKPELSFNVINNYGGVLKAKTSGLILGYSYQDAYLQTDKPIFTRDINTGENISIVKIIISMAAEEYNKVTDLAVNIYNQSGNSVLSTGMSRKSAVINFTPPAPGKYQLELVPAFVSKEIMAKEWNFTIEEKYFYHTPAPIKPETADLTIYPGINYELKCKVEGTIPAIPDECHTFGEIDLINKNNDDLIHKQMIYIE